ncbi:MAG: hypothetical protein IH614_12080, partial [Desulfuromonadales bacterium]|nr:hypothetical protein [Desulfuromonadales bacterium]
MSRITLLEMLLRADLITEEQFDAALQNRVLYGGKIGTSLIELGYLSEVDLARFLSKKLAVPYVAPEHLKNIPTETIAALPKPLAIKYQAIPLKLENKKLALAMVDPSDLKAVDEISFATGYIIRPVIAPEVRLIEALAVYYEAVVDPRYLEIAKRLEEQRCEDGGKQPPVPAPPTAAAARAPISLVPPLPAERPQVAAKSSFEALSGPSGAASAVAR